MTLIKKMFPSPVGPLLALADADFLYYLGFLGQKKQEQTLAKIADLVQEQISSGSNALLEALEKDLSAYFTGELTSFQIATKTFGTPFQEAVWRVMVTIPYGQTMTYKELAQSLGDSKKARAVGLACGNNPILFLNPCHRVLSSDGGLGGYVAGLEKKQFLLILEKNE
ncbi:methylated-DNA--[protein]-cysteine S-methyltransferase [Streptococcus cuniculipharyngis]|uniref:methylated-DNA--[protein]-cysteine S-methyltransferase n=1 Tax=Streptococcus cuniculipharyngis TaxID=1562651 RepID=A0A5C5SEF6_9STRE|nr:methylated-DNA--[protein]-cysteine S-methyltransferase [Streptococcus cuniculipharyngis]TWS99254.1 methylated-DNA--[protein]-cysteine S-methyltransferase [Streptococcus cuniculipharyngis]